MFLTRSIIRHGRNMTSLFKVYALISSRTHSTGLASYEIKEHADLSNDLKSLVRGWKGRRSNDNEISRNKNTAFGTLMDNLMQERIKNAGKFNVSHVEKRANRQRVAKNFDFPDEYRYLLKLNDLSMQTLRSNKKLWETITSDSTETSKLIEKEVALICLEWAQNIMNANRPAWKRTKDEFDSEANFIPQSMLRSIERIKSGTLNNIISPRGFSKPDNYMFGEAFKALLPEIKKHTGLNDLQAKALYSICTSSHSLYPYNLQGPPGTGKTRVIAETVRCLLSMDPNARILLTAPSNMAANLLALKIMELIDSNVVKSSNVIRLQAVASEFEERDKRLDLISKFDSKLDEFKIPKASNFKRYRVVICTLGCSTHIINKEVPPGFFSHIFLDEAGQAKDAEIWIPLGGLATRSTSVIFCGDTKQLGPVNTLDLPLNVTQGLGSALTRYMEMPCYQNEERMSCQLQESYRCHPSILSAVSSLFYNNTLKSGIVNRIEPFHNWRGLPKKGFPVLFVNVNGQQYTGNGSVSYANNQEVSVTLSYIRQLFKDFKLDPADVGIISPYRHQTKVLKDRLEKARIIDSRKMTIDSVERFQGSERKVIIMSTTRTEGLGFVGCDLRLNTSISRAMHLLIVIGNKDTLYGHPSWRKFINYCEQNKSLINWSGEVQTF